MNAEVILALAHLTRVIHLHIPDNPSKHLALKELETVEFQLAFATSLNPAA